MTDSAPPPPELARLRRRFIGLMIAQGVLGAAATGFALAFFMFHQSWGLPAFAIALAAAVVAQVRFIWMFKTTRG